MDLVEVERTVNGMTLTFQEDAAVAEERGFTIVDRAAPVKAAPKKSSKK